MHTANTPGRAKRLKQARQAARLRRTRLTTAPAVGEEAGAAPVSTRDGTWRARFSHTRSFLTRVRSRLPRRRQSKKDTVADWQNWSRFRLWRRTRPFWGSIWMLVAALILLVFPISLLQFALLVNTLWAGLLIGGLLLVMGLIQLFLPSYAVITGSIGMVLSLVSFVTNTFGGLALGMLLGIVGCALSIAWRPLPRSRLLASVSHSA